MRNSGATFYIPKSDASLSCVCLFVRFDVLILLFPPGSVSFAAIKAADSSSQRFCCSWRAGVGSAGRSESGGGERRHGGVLSQVWYVSHLMLLLPLLYYVVLTFH